MADIRQEMTIGAAPERVYEAITTRNGLSGWWTDDASAADKIGSVAEFGFFSHAMVFRMRVDELAPSTRVKWTCIGGPDEWMGTQVSFDLAPALSDSTLVRFTHSGWRAEDGMYPSATATWAHIMPHLKGYVEGKAPGPYFKRDSQ
jgi:uncharacterized protein YndB with AHSA1/START domain